MSQRRARRLRVGVLGAAAALAAVASVAFLLGAARPGHPLRSDFAAGGFALELPGGWSIDGSHPSTPSVWVEAQRPTRAGTPSAWLWVARWSPSGDDALAVAADAAAADVRDRWGDISLTRSDTRFLGERAITLRYTRPLLGLVPVMPGARAEELRMVTLRSGQVYEVGIGGWRRLPPEVATLEQHVRLVTPRGTRAVDEARLGMRVGLPASFNVHHRATGDDDGIAWSASGPHDPPSEWATLWTFDSPLQDAVADSVAAAGRLGTIASQVDTVIAGRPAVRIEFEQDTPSASPTFFVTWHFEGPDGRAWQLLVGGIEPVATTASLVESSLALRN